MGPRLTPLAHRGRTARAAGSDGFSLIELVIVVAILSVLAIGAGLVATRAGGSAAQSDANRFVRQFESARSRAIQGREVRGLHVTARGLQNATRTGDDWTTADGLIRWRGRVTFQGAAPPGDLRVPDIVLLPDGRVSEFSVLFRSGAGARLRCRHDPAEGVTCG